MLFHSIDFVIFFPIVVMAYFILPKKLKNVWLLVASYYFYMNWNAKYALLLFGASLITYLASFAVSRMAENKRGRQWVLAGALVLVFAILAYFKYVNFALQSVVGVVNAFGSTLQIPEFDIILPVGISFFTFQAAGYLIDVYRGEVELERNPITYFLFVSFFPQLVAGPIERSKNLLQQMHTTYQWDRKRIERGLCIMLWGYFLKLVLADRCAVLVDSIFRIYPEHHGLLLILGAILFSLQIYFDFMGYSTIARGAALVLGYRLMDNFHQPYFATSIKEFWRRWHISLSTWFRDYLYIPLGGNRCSKGRKYFNLMVTFLVSGLWHGANWTFVIWGGIHGLYQVIGDLLAPVLAKIRKVCRVREEATSFIIFRIVRTDILAVIAWVFFRAETITGACNYLKNCVTGGLELEAVWGDAFYTYGLNEWHMNLLLIGLVVFFIFSFLRERGVAVLNWVYSQGVVLRYIIYWALVILIIFSLDLSGQEFIYFQF